MENISIDLSNLDEIQIDFFKEMLTFEILDASEIIRDKKSIFADKEETLKKYRAFIYLIYNKVKQNSIFEVYFSKLDELQIKWFKNMIITTLETHDEIIKELFSDKDNIKDKDEMELFNSYIGFKNILDEILSKIN